MINSWARRAQSFNNNTGVLKIHNDLPQNEENMEKDEQEEEW